MPAREGSGFVGGAGRGAWLPFLPLPYEGRGSSVLRSPRGASGRKGERIAGKEFLLLRPEMELSGLSAAEAEAESGRRGLCGRVHESASRWVLPEGARASYLERASCLPPPLFILFVSAAELSVFAFYAVREPQAQWVTLESGIWESPLTYRPDRRSQAWRFLSYMLVHAGIEHILGNLVLQLVLGIPLELVHKGHRVGLVYLAGVLGGSLASSVCDPLLGLVGASGGVYALIGGYFMNVLVNFREMIPLFGVARLLFIFIIGFLRGPHCGRTGRDVSGIRHIQLLRQKFRQGPPVLGLHWCLCALRGVCCVLQCIPLSSKPVERWDGCPRALKDKNIQKYICMLRSAYLGTARPLALPSHYGTVCLLYLILKKQSFSIAVLVLCSGGLGVAAEGQAI
uniref:rhomboid protease n=1 Tax=Anolis carolinensis TaxID=28377 RepID=H9GNT4_ANOCA